MREAEEKRNKRTSDEQQLHDAMLSAIFKSVFEDTVPDSAVGIHSSGKKDRMGCDIPKVIDFQPLPIGVQDDLMKAEILPDNVALIQDFRLRAHVPLLPHDRDQETDGLQCYLP